MSDPGSDKQFVLPDEHPNGCRLPNGIATARFWRILRQVILPSCVPRATATVVAAAIWCGCGGTPSGGTLVNLEVNPIARADLQAGRRIELDVKLGDFGKAIPQHVLDSSTVTMHIRFVATSDALTPAGRIPVWHPAQSAFGDVQLSKADVWVRCRLREGPQTVRLGIETYVLTTEDVARLGASSLIAQIRVDDERQASLVRLLPRLDTPRPAPTAGSLALPAG